MLTSSLMFPWNTVRDSLGQTRLDVAQSDSYDGDHFRINLSLASEAFQKTVRTWCRLAVAISLL